MPATITLVGENKTEATFDEALEALSSIEREAQDAGIATADLNKELESRAASRYASAVKQAADEWDGTAQAMRDAKEESERLADEQERITSRNERITAMSTGFLAVAEGLKIAAEWAASAYEFISKLAEEGDDGMQLLKSSIDGAGGSLEGLAARFLSVGGELTWLGRAVRSTADDVSWLTSALAGMTEQEARNEEGIRATNFALEEFNRLVEESSRLQSIATETDVESLQKRIDYINQTIEGVQSGERQDITADVMTKMLETRAALESRAAELRKKAAEEEANATAKMIDELRAGAEEQAQRAEAEDIRKREEQNRLAVEEKLARHEAELEKEEARQKEIAHVNRMVTLEQQAAEKKREAEGESAPEEESVNERMRKGDRFSEIVTDRQRKATEEYLKEQQQFIAQINDPRSGMTGRERQAGISEIRRGASQAQALARQRAVEEAQSAQSGATQETMIVNEELIRNQQVMARQLESLRTSAQQQGARARDIRRGLGNG